MTGLQQPMVSISILKKLKEFLEKEIWHLPPKSEHVLEPEGRKGTKYQKTG